jgi:acyl-coenzyme A synthetase/AMP-(fatty) acid ligase
MLYQRWLTTASDHADAVAITHEGGAMCFGELAAAAEAAPQAVAPVVARADGPGFFIDILRAWRDGQAAMPVEKIAAVPVLARRPPDGVALVKHTPGAGGIPRGIFFTPSALIDEADRLATAMALTPDSPNLAVVSLAHSYGFGNIVLPLLLHGIPVVWLDVPFPRIVEAAIEKHSPLTIPAVPSIWRAWHRAGILARAEIRLAISAGSPLPADLERQVFESSRLKIHNLYGTSETGAISWDATATPRDHGTEVGTPLPGVRVAIDAASGRIRVESPALACGYDSPRPGDTLDDGYHLTHDLGETDAANRLHLHGTLDGAINVAGRKVSPEKVRRAMLATGLLDEAAITPVASTDPDRHQEIHARLIWKSGVPPDLDALKHHLATTLSPWEIPRHWAVGER